MARGWGSSLLVVVLALAGCSEPPSAVAPESTGAPAATVEVSPAPTALRVGVTESDVLNGTYPWGLGGRESVKLSDGAYFEEYELPSSSGRTLRLRESIKVFSFGLGDIDGDGTGDAAVVVGYNGGGTGTFMRLVPVLFDDGRAVTGKLVGLGDRSNPRAVTVDSTGTIRLDVVVHQLGDPLCCPTLPLALEFALEDGALRWRNPEVCAGRCADPIGGVR